MSLNLFRTKMKKKKGIKNSDPTVLGIVSPGSYGSGLSSGGGPVGSSLVQIIGPATVKEAKRKAVSVTTPPDMSPSHQVSGMKSCMLGSLLLDSAW